MAALARTGSPVFFGIRDKSPNVKKMARTCGTKNSFRQILIKPAPMKFTELKILIVFFFRCPASNVFSQKEATLIRMTKFSSAKKIPYLDMYYLTVSIIK